MVFETSWDDGGKYDPKIVELLKKYKLEKYSTFYIPLNCQMGLEWVKSLSLDFKIGGHTVNHPQDIKLLEGEFLDFEIIHSKGLLESTINKEIDSFCYPRGRYNDFIKSLVKEAGWVEARTTKVLKTDTDFDPYEKPTTIHVFPRKEYKGEDWKSLAVKTFLEAKALGDKGYFHIWGHSIELQRNDEWADLEAFFDWAVEEGIE